MHACALEVSTNLGDGQQLLSVDLNDLSNNFSDLHGSGPAFYRAHLASMAFAPADLANKTTRGSVRPSAHGLIALLCSYPPK